MSGVSRPPSAEMFHGAGFRVKRNICRPATEIIEQYRQFPTPDISDALNRLYMMTSEIKSLVNGVTSSGPACTVNVFPRDNFMVHKALDIAQPGDIVVIDAGAHP